MGSEMCIRDRDGDIYIHVSKQWELLKARIRVKSIQNGKWEETRKCTFLQFENMKLFRSGMNVFHQQGKQWSWLSCDVGEEDDIREQNFNDSSSSAAGTLEELQ